MIERMSVTGGQATSIALDKSRYGAEFLNDGVQGGSRAFSHTFRFFKQYGHEPREVKLQVSFGKGKDGFWSNVFPSPLVQQFSKDIKKFGRVLRLIRWFMPVLGLVPIKFMLRLFFFSPEFGSKMVYPLIALFLGTGNQTPNVACAILERLFNDPNMKLWDYDPDTLLPNLPTMVTFPKLDQFYKDWAADLQTRGVKIHLNTDVRAIRRTGQGVEIVARPFNPNLNERKGEHTDPDTSMGVFDELVLCTLADDALKLLGKSASWREKFVLGGARFYDDITITHSDSEYFDKMYETRFDSTLSAQPKNKVQASQIAFAKGELANADDQPAGFRPMYYTHSYKEDPTSIEMSFDCTNYQHQFRLHEDGSPKTQDGNPSIPYENHVFQSIFLDSSRAHLWTLPQISESKIIERKWWHQLGHRWQHYVRVVPGMMFLHGRNKTWFAGSWTLVNMHELACVSGIAAAWRLGADYVAFDDFAETFFRNYVLLCHGRLYRKQRANSKKGR